MTAERIDAHHHLWRLDRGDYGWLTAEHGPIYRDFAFADFAPLLRDGDIGRTILVQAAPSEAETGYLLDLAAAHAPIAGVVGWTDFDAPDAVQAVARLAAHPKLVGLRPMIQDIEDDRWLARPNVGRALEAVAAAGVAFDALVLPRHLAVLREAALRHGGLRIVIDHAAKPEITERRIEPWARDMRRLARETPVLCKLSGLVTEAGSQWSVADLKPYVEVLLEAFGPERLIWGSDWPVLNLAGDYRRWRDATAELLAGLDEPQRDAVLGGNARAFYRIG